MSSEFMGVTAKKSHAHTCEPDLKKGFWKSGQPESRTLSNLIEMVIRIYMNAKTFQSSVFTKTGANSR